MTAITICTDLGAPQNKVSHCSHCFPIYLPWSDGTRCHDLRFLNVDVFFQLLNFKPAFSLSFFTLIKKFFSSSSLSAIRVTNLDTVLRSRDITLPTKAHLVKAMVFPVVKCGCESWTIKKAEHWRTDVFQMWCWRRLLRVPWTARRPNQSILKEINPEYSLEWLMLKLQYFGQLMGRTDSLEKTLMLGKIEGGRRRGWDGWMASPTQWTSTWAISRRQRSLACYSPWDCKELDIT